MDISLKVWVCMSLKARRRAYLEKFEQGTYLEEQERKIHLEKSRQGHNYLHLCDFHFF